MANIEKALAELTRTASRPEPEFPDAWMATSEARNLLVRAAAKQNERRFSAEPAAPSAFGNL